MTAFARPLPLPAVTVASVAWALAIALFILLRVGVVWRAPVGGAAAGARCLSLPWRPDAPTARRRASWT